MSSGTIPKKYLIVSQYYYPDVTAAAFRIKETVDILLSLGHRVTVIAAEPHRGDIGKSRPIDDGRATVLRVPIVRISGKSKWNYILHYLSFMWNAILAALSHHGPGPDVVLASSPPLFVGVAGWIISRITGGRFVLDIRDIWPDSAVVVGQLRRESIIFKVAKIVEKSLYKKARLVSCVARPMGDYIRAVSGKSPVIIYNGIPRDYFQVNRTAAGKIIHLLADGKMNIMYVGNMGFCQNLDLVLDAALRFKEEGIQDIQFLLIGTGVERPLLEEKKRRLGLRNVVIDGPVQKEEAMELMRNASALCLQLKDDGTMEKTIPSKVFDYMVAGKPILYGIKGEGDEILRSVAGNLAFQPGSVDSFVGSIRELRRDYPALARAAEENSRRVQDQFVREDLVRKLDDRIQTLFG